MAAQLLSFMQLSFLLLFFLILSVGCHGRAAQPVVAVQQADVQGPIKLFVDSIKQARRHLAAAAVARSTSIFLMYPVDTMKTRIQMGQANPLRLAGVFSGVAGSLVGQVPYGVLTFGSYEMYKDFLLDRFPTMKPVFVYAMSAVLGDLTGSGWLCPSEVVKQQMQAGMYTSTRQAVSSIWKKKGLVGLYEGYFGGVARDVPFRVAQLTTFELTKSVALKLKQQRRSQRNEECDNEKSLELSPIEAAACGAVAGTISAAVTCPLDRIKTLLMTDSQAYGGTVFSCAAKIWAQDGLAGFTQGLIPRVVYIAPSVVIFFTAYELTQQRLKNWGKDE
mmetsp:Transcript_11734/g.15420  ORF Transcript_11734/g.15420 Transcript_11734/m.15420 type:complete len:333 (-) Transcript_11734:185-1183(-)|eukprot:CAMPEP_0198143622 /NCGR_PEP_ID=MMETSP1443-20131203/8573_1 /TAXON_ID=186043 /ORGANISM="Entomoneis sp., Strain CCMP2396" /LENGTH=332 /DNA_ID=CAMNT_0043806885 /DNA_START=94 /DNA_END=1092 /DNA_ORIENTATION=+